MKAFTLSKEAERDLDSIARYLREKAGIRVARHVLRELRSGIRFIAKNPDSGHFRQDLTADAVKGPFSLTSSSMTRRGGQWRSCAYCTEGATSGVF